MYFHNVISMFRSLKYWCAEYSKRLKSTSKISTTFTTHSLPTRDQNRFSSSVVKRSFCWLWPTMWLTEVRARSSSICLFSNLMMCEKLSPQKGQERCWWLNVYSWSVGTKPLDESRSKIKRTVSSGLQKRNKNANRFLEKKKFRLKNESFKTFFI